MGIDHTDQIFSLQRYHPDEGPNLEEARNILSETITTTE